MGYRSTITSNCYGYELPKWFIDKHDNRSLIFNYTILSSKVESKYYDNELFEDYQKALIELGVLEPDSFDVYAVLLHEDGEVTRITISYDKIEYELLTNDYGLPLDRPWGK